MDANTARLLRNYALVLVNDYLLSRGGQPPIRVEDRTWFNETKESRLAIIPGVIAMVMAVIGALMTSLTIAKEMEQGNLVMLRTTPLTRREFLLGKLLPYLLIGLLDLAVAVAVAVFVFEMPLRGSLAVLLLLSALFLLVVMLQGALISINAGNQLLASQISLVSTFCRRSCYPASSSPSRTCRPCCNTSPWRCRPAITSPCLAPSSSKGWCRCCCGRRQPRCW